MRGFIKSIATVTTALAFTVVPMAGAHAATASPTNRCMPGTCNGGGDSGWEQQSYGDSSEYSSDRSSRNFRPRPRPRPRPRYQYEVPGGGSYNGGRCDAPYGPSGPKRGCPWN